MVRRQDVRVGGRDTHGLKAYIIPTGTLVLTRTQVLAQHHGHQHDDLHKSGQIAILPYELRGRCVDASLETTALPEITAAPAGTLHPHVYPIRGHDPAAAPPARRPTRSLLPTVEASMPMHVAARQQYHDVALMQRVRGREEECPRTG